MYVDFDPVLSISQCGFQQGYRTIEKWKKALVTTDLSKVFDRINCNLLTAHDSLKFVHSYVTDRKQKTEINNGYSSCSV